MLDEALDTSVPLLERVKFLAIVSSNLDEFFMVRVAGLKRQNRLGDHVAGPDGMTPQRTASAVAAKAHELTAEQHRCWIDELQPALVRERVRVVRPPDADAAQRAHVDQYFRTTLLPVLTPLAIDPGHPFPHLANRSLCLVASIGIEIVAEDQSLFPAARLIVVHMPPNQVIPRFVPLPCAPGEHAFMLLEDVVRLHLPSLYRGYRVISCHAVRVTRDAEIAPEEAGAPDLLTGVEASLQVRRMGLAVRLQYDADLPANVLSVLVDELDLGPEDLYPNAGFTAFSDLFQLYASVDLPHLKDAPLSPLPVAAFQEAADVWSAVRAGDILVHHPYQSFDVVTRFVEAAALDPKVLAIKMTLYRVSPTSPIARALMTAAEHGKEVAVLVELKARFDEEANIRWAKALEAVGAHVVYGLPRYKTHCKACLVVRQEGDRIVRYCHVATGNYNARTAGLYTDLGLFTSRETFGEDLTELFNLITGYMFPRSPHHLLVAPAELRRGLSERVRREIAHAREGRPARIILKMNSLVDPDLIELLYEASRTGVDISLIVRGICCLRPGVSGVSERIEVTSIVDRFLEHARIFFCQNAGTPERLLSSADWMPRNLDHRVEIAFPVLEPRLQALVREVLDVQLSDTVKARRLVADGKWQRLNPYGAGAIRAQRRLYEVIAHHEDDPSSHSNSPAAVT